MDTPRRCVVPWVLMPAQDDHHYYTFHTTHDDHHSHVHVSWMPDEDAINAVAARLGEAFGRSVAEMADGIRSLARSGHVFGEFPSYTYNADDGRFDARPDSCWRCDATTATTEVGLCDPCHATLKETA